MKLIHRNPLHKTERENKETIPFTVAMKKKKKKNLGINLPKEIKNVYIENCKTLRE